MASIFHLNNINHLWFSHDINRWHQSKMQWFPNLYVLFFQLKQVALQALKIQLHIQFYFCLKYCLGIEDAVESKKRGFLFLNEDQKKLMEVHSMYVFQKSPNYWKQIDHPNSNDFLECLHFLIILQINQGKQNHYSRRLYHHEIKIDPLLYFN